MRAGLPAVLVVSGGGFQGLAVLTAARRGSSCRIVVADSLGTTLTAALRGRHAARAACRGARSLRRRAPLRSAVRRTCGWCCLPPTTSSGRSRRCVRARSRGRSRSPVVRRRAPARCCATRGRSTPSWLLPGSRSCLRSTRRLRAVLPVIGKPAPRVGQPRRRGRPRRGRARGAAGHAPRQPRLAAVPRGRSRAFGGFRDPWRADAPRGGPAPPRAHLRRLRRRLRGRRGRGRARHRRALRRAGRAPAGRGACSTCRCCSGSGGSRSPT